MAEPQHTHSQRDTGNEDNEDKPDVKFPGKWQIPLLERIKPLFHSHPSMLETITLALATPIAKIILDKLYEGLGSKLGEKAVEVAAVPIQKLGQAVWNRCFKSKPGTDQLLEAAAKGSEPELKQIHDYLLEEMKKPEFIGMVQPLAEEVYQAINIKQMNGGEVWNVSGGKAEKNEFKDIHAPILKDVTSSTINITYTNTPKPD